MWRCHCCHLGYAPLSLLLCSRLSNSQQRHGISHASVTWLHGDAGKASIWSYMVGGGRYLLFRFMVGSFQAWEGGSDEGWSRKCMSTSGWTGPKPLNCDFSLQGCRGDNWQLWTSAMDLFRGVFFCSVFFFPIGNRFIEIEFIYTVHFTYLKGTICLASVSQ